MGFGAKPQYSRKKTQSQSRPRSGLRLRRCRCAASLRHASPFPRPRPLLGIPQKPRNISKNRGYPAIVHICPQMGGCYPHQCGQLCGKLGITPGGRADNRESRPCRVKRSPPQKVRRILAFWALQNEVKIRAGVWRLQKWKTRVLAAGIPKNRRPARRMRGREGRGEYGALGSRVRRSKAALRKQPVR